MREWPDTHKSITVRSVMEAVERDDNTGICVNCGAERDCCEPDARGYECDECGEMTVFGAAELLMMMV